MALLIFCLAVYLIIILEFPWVTYSLPMLQHAFKQEMQNKILHQIGLKMLTPKNKDHDYSVCPSLPVYPVQNFD